MKLQYLAIIFIIIVVPISLVLSLYINNQIKSLNYQSKYDLHLIDATYDAIKAFQLNTYNNRFSTLGNSKIRDIEAAINTYFDSLSTNFNNYTANDIKEHTPAILFNLYDGYYIYSKYFDTELNDYTFGLKPFMYYSCRYKYGENTDFVVNYTLDNTITIIGKVNGDYVSKTGHLISLDDEVLESMNLSSYSSWEELEAVLNSNTNENLNKYKEVLKEDLIIFDSTKGTNQKTETFEYIVYNSQKVYKNNNASANNEKYFYYSTGNTKNFVNSEDTIELLDKHIGEGNHFYSYSAIQYYYEAQEFTKWVNSNLKGIKQSHAVDNEGNKITFASDTGEADIFVTSKDNNPLKSNSVFNENRLSVIRKSIETNLIVAIDNFSDHSKTQYEFVMPNLTEDDWYKIENNISIVTFLQGLPISAKVYNNYCAISNNTNQEMVGTNSLYVIDSNGKYHLPGCQELIDSLYNGTTIEGIYLSSDFQRKSISITGSDSNAHGQLTGSNQGTYVYFYPKMATSCYNCIVTASNGYSTDDIIANTIKTSDGKNLDSSKLSNPFLIALARVRYNLYVTNGYFGY